MRSKTIIAGPLIVLGIVALAYSSITDRTRGRPVDIGRLHTQTTKTHLIPRSLERSRWLASSCCLHWTPEGRCAMSSRLRV